MEQKLVFVKHKDLPMFFIKKSSKIRMKMWKRESGKLLMAKIRSGMLPSRTITWSQVATSSMLTMSYTLAGRNFSTQGILKKNVLCMIFRIGSPAKWQPGIQESRVNLFLQLWLLFGASRCFTPRASNIIHVLHV